MRLHVGVYFYPKYCPLDYKTRKCQYFVFENNILLQCCSLLMHADSATYRTADQHINHTADYPAWHGYVIIVEESIIAQHRNIDPKILGALYICGISLHRHAATLIFIRSPFSHQI